MNKYLRLGVSAALMAFIGFRTDWAKVGSAFAHLRVHWWLAGLALLGVAQVLSAIRWQIMARALRFDRSWREMTGFYFIGMFFNLVLPTSVGGDVVRAWYLDGKTGRKLGAFASVFLDRLSGLVMLLVLACTAVVLSPDLPPAIVWSVWVTTGGIVGGLLSLPVLARFIPRLKRRLPQVRGSWAQVATPGVLLSTTLLSAGVQVACVLIVWFLGLALEAPIPATFYWVLVPMVSLSTLLPISVNGIGVRENCMALMLGPLGVSEGMAVSLGLLWFTVQAVLSLAGGLVYAFGRYSRPKTADFSTEGQIDNGPVYPHPDQGRTGQHKAAA